jgi:hypothetical protein
MAAWFVGAATALTLTLPAVGDAKTAKDKPADAKADTHRVELRLLIAGLGSGGCDVEVKPGHAGCKFRPQSGHVSSQGVKVLEINDLQMTGADRDCAFAITITEPGHPIRTVHKGLYLRTHDAKLDCWLSSPSKLASAKDAETKKRR